MRIYIFLVTFSLVTLATEYAFAKKINGSINLVKLADVVANPSKYNGKRIVLEGCLNLKFEANAIYPDVQNCEKDYKNGLWVSLSRKSQNILSPQPQKFKVKIEGILYTNDNGHMGLWPAALHNVKIIKSELIKERN